MINVCSECGKPIDPQKDVNYAGFWGRDMFRLHPECYLVWMKKKKEV